MDLRFHRLTILRMRRLGLNLGCRQIVGMRMISRNVPKGRVVMASLVASDSKQVGWLELILPICLSINNKLFQILP